MGSLTPTHLVLARLVLLQYDVVMVLEAPDTNTLHFKYGLGWGLTLKHVASRNNSKASRIIDHHASELLPKDPETLLEANGLDVQLYHYGVLLQQLDGFMYDVADALGMKPYSDFRLYHGPRIHTGHGGVILGKGTDSATVVQKGKYKGNGTCGYLRQEELLSHGGLPLGARMREERRGGRGGWKGERPRGGDSSGEEGDAVGEVGSERLADLPRSEPLLGTQTPSGNATATQ